MSGLIGMNLHVRSANAVRIFAWRHALANVLVLLVSLTPHLAMSGEACESTDQVQFICGIQNAEDLIRVPGAKLVIASGRESATAGTLYAIDSETRTHIKLFPNDAADRSVARAGAAECPGPISQFQPHGISVKQTAKDRYVLYVVGHGQREAIEIFRLRLDDKRPSLQWAGCIPAPEGVERFNAVTALPGEAIAVTHLPPSDSPRRGSGEIWAWSETDGWAIIPGGHISGANGIVAAPDGNSLYVSEYFSESLLQISLDAVPVETKTYHVGYSIDNIRWAESGQLLLTAHDRNCDTKGRCDKGAPGAQVIAFDPQTESSSKLLFYPSQTFFPVGTVTEEVNGTLWMGGIRGTDRIVVFQEPY